MDHSAADPTAILDLDDQHFEVRWFEISDEEKAALPRSVRAECIERYTRLHSYSSPSGIDRVQRQFDAAVASWRQEAPELPPAPYISRRMRWADLAQREPPERLWAEPGWLGYGHVTLLAGSGGIGKSLLAMQWLAAHAMGRHFLDPDEVPPVKVVGWFCEDDHDEIWRRQIAISQHMGIGLAEFEDNFIVEPRVGMENTMVSEQYGTLIFSNLLKQFKEQADDEHAQVVVLDNIAQLYGARENDRHQVTAFINRLTGDHPGRAILLLGHPAKMAGSEYSGSTAWEAAVRTRLYLGDKLPDAKPDEDGDSDSSVRYLARRKANYSAKDWRRFTYQEGVLIPDEVATTGGGLIENIRRGNCEKLILDAISRLAGMDIFATESSASPQFLPKLILNYKLAEGFTRPELTTAMRAQMLAGRVVRAQIGQYSNRTPRFGLKVS